MIDKKTDGRETKIQKPKEKSESITNARNIGENGRDSGCTQYQQERVSREVDAGMGRTTIYWSLGGILGLFREVMREGYDYIDAHGERLEKRLVDHKNRKASFLEKSAALEKEIARLLEQVEKLPEEIPTEEE